MSSPNKFDVKEHYTVIDFFADFFFILSPGIPMFTVLPSSHEQCFGWPSVKGYPEAMMRILNNNKKREKTTRKTRDGLLRSLNEEHASHDKKDGGEGGDTDIGDQEGARDESLETIV